MNWTLVLRQDVAPTASTFAVFGLLFVWYIRRHQRGAPAVTSPPSVGPAGEVRWSGLLRRIVGMLAVGYPVFALIIVTFYLVLGGQGGPFVLRALIEGAVLGVVVVLPGFLGLTWAESAIRRRRASNRLRM
jgi:hypothetical protein